jgi:hypothetical protein
MERRQLKDRRAKPTPILSRYSFLGGKRRKARRGEDRRGGYYIDRYGAGAFVLFSIIILLNAFDGFLAFYILHTLGDVDTLPLTAIHRMGGETFILAAFVIASLCALVLFLHKNFPVARLTIAIIIFFQILTIVTQLILILFYQVT